VKKDIIRLFFLLITACTLTAFSFSPIIQDFDPAGRGSIQTFRIKNDNEEPIAVQISIMTRRMNTSGEENNSDASDFFTVYPHQLILQPNDSQSVRVQWKGPETVHSEQPFRIIAEQLPISFNGESSEKGQLNIVYRYVGSVYVLPESPASDVTLESVTATESHLTIRLYNRGNSHTILEDLIVSLNNGAKTVSLDYRDLEKMAGENILAGTIRDFIINRPSQLTGEEISGEISYKETR